MAEASQTGRPRGARLSKTAVGILAYVGRNEGEPRSKAQIAEALGRNVKTVDRLIARLRDEGLLVVDQRWAENGGQLANTYRLPRVGGDG
ncbi:Rrf2 family transcriptional regulator [Olsenella sp. An293]|uniref:Rrf2 family transcriptional regulator n=1 Tax=Olsenella sp. An293 TaxID=1965626 RepID=UPI000B3A6226|nr:Rrf2 family transcriptional regulator [Olsenella sp. An293]OUO33967.1 hypothetical protein B5F85_01155 [Olsenella sp. An293]